jgi:type IV pilus assembly protein PilM
MVSFNWKSRTCRPIGLDIGSNSIKMIQLAVNAGHFTVIAADKVHIEPSVAADWSQHRSCIISGIQEMLAHNPFKGRNVVSCLPNEKLKITSLRIGGSDNSQIEQVLKKEVSYRFGLDPEKDSINYLSAGSVKQGDEIKNELILFAAQNETIRSHIHMLEEAQLRPVAIDTIPCALFRNFERSARRQEEKDTTVVFVDLGMQFTTVVFGRRGEINFIKQIPIGLQKFNEQIAARLGIGINEAETLRNRIHPHAELRSDAHDADTDGAENAPVSCAFDEATRQVVIDAIGSTAEELAKEISLCFRYYTVTFRGKSIERAIFAGGGAYENILLSVLRGQLTVEIEVAQPMRGFDISDVRFDSDRRGMLCEWAVAVGLGLKGCKPAGGDDHERN